MKAPLLIIASLLANSLYASSLETVTITAERHQQADVAASISSIDQLESFQPTHISEVLASSPGTWISRGNGQEHLTAIRSPVFTGAGSCGEFLMAEDNIPLRAPAFCNVNQLFDTFYEMADHIEVMRGPGTAFHGSNAIHGMINVISPRFSDQPQTTLAISDTSHGNSSLGLDHRTATFIAQSLITRDTGYKEDSGYDQQKLRLKALQQGDNWQLTHNLSYMNLEQETAGYIEGLNAYRDEDLKQANNNPEAYRNAESIRLWSEWRFHPDTESELIFSPYLRSNKMDFLMHFQPGDPLEQNGHDSIGFQSAFIRPYSKSTRLVTGFDVDYTEGYLKQHQEAIVSFDPIKFPVGDHYDYDVNVYTLAMFIQSETALTEHWDMTLGMRLEHARFDYTNNLTDGIVCSGTPCRYYRPADDILSFYDASPKFTTRYQFNNHHSTFVSIKQAHRTPQTSELFRLEEGQQLANIDSEQIDAIEWGFNGQIAGKVDYQLSLYHMHKDNVIFKTADRQTVDNQKTHHQGIEASLHWMISDDWWMNSQFSYAKHQYASDIELFGSSNAAIDGNMMDTAPRHLHNVQLGWHATPESQLMAEIIYLGKYYLDPENSQSYPGHTLTNLRYQQRLADDWQIAVAVMNLGNKDYADRADVNPISGEPRYFIGEPRSFRLNIEKTFK